MSKTGKTGQVHFIGIGGIGMSALARYFLAQNWAVSGSDMIDSSITRNLAKAGIRVKISHRKSNLSPSTDLVITTVAAPRTNPELIEAKRHKIPVQTYPEALGSLTDRCKTVAVAGAHGKSTTTAMAALAMIRNGFNPAVIIGTTLKEFGNTNFRPGKSNWLIIEADEYRGAFLHYKPFAAIITNIDKEHLDYYKNLNVIKKAFLKFIGNIQQGGTLVLNADDPTLASLRRKIQNVAQYHKIKTLWVSSLKSGDAKKIKKILRVPGKHNVGNALLAYALVRALGGSAEKTVSALASFRGTARRLDHRGVMKFEAQDSRFKKVPVYDDYAHHPTEIKASLQALREKYSKSKIICVFQPHQATRLKALFSEFQTAFGDADALVFLPVYQVTGRDKPDPRFSSQILAEKIARGKTPAVVYLPKPTGTRIRAAILSLIRNSRLGLKDSVVVMMGAGNIVEYTSDMIHDSTLSRPRTC